MTGDQLKALACNGLATIGSHTVVHPNLLQCSEVRGSGPASTSDTS